MATEAQSTRERTTIGDLRVYRLTVDQFKAMIDAGILRDGDRVELLGGLLVEKMTKNDPHDYAVDALGKSLERLLAPAWIAREEKSVVLGRRWRPEPDVALVRGPRSRYKQAAPVAADIALIAEVADSSAGRDRRYKLRRYAACRVPYYWVLLVGKHEIEVHSEPVGRGATASYRTRQTYAAGSEVPVIVEGKEVARIAVDDIVP